MGFPMPTSLRLTWEAPLFTSNLTHYMVTCIGLSQPLTNRTIGTEMTFTFENLIPETAYWCSVTAVANATDGGSISSSYTTTTPGACAHAAQTNGHTVC